MGHAGAIQADIEAMLLHLWSASVTVGAAHFFAEELSLPHCFTPSPTTNKTSKRWQVARLLTRVEEQSEGYVMAPTWT